MLEEKLRFVHKMKIKCSFDMKIPKCDQREREKKRKGSCLWKPLPPGVFFSASGREVAGIQNLRPSPAESCWFVRLGRRGWHSLFTLCFCASALLCPFFPSFVNKGLYNCLGILSFGILGVWCVCTIMTTI